MVPSFDIAAPHLMLTRAPLKELKAWAGNDEPMLALVLALTHHGWMRGGLFPCRETNSPTCRNVVRFVRNDVLPSDCFAVGKPTGSLIVSCFVRLKAAGAPETDLAELWSCFSGVASTPGDLPESDDLDSSRTVAVDEGERASRQSTRAVREAGQPPAADRDDGAALKFQPSALDAPVGHRVVLVSPEACRVVEFETAPTVGANARRSESVLRQGFESWLTHQGHEVRRVLLYPDNEKNPLVTDTYDETNGVLYEAKSNIDRATVRLGVGQLLDYLRFFDDVKGSLLLPSEPSEDLCSFIFSCGLSLTFPQGNSWMTKPE